VTSGEPLSSRFLAEVYRPYHELAQLEADARGIADASAALSERGLPVRHLQAVFLPEEETCLHLFEAARLDAVERALQDTGLEAERISLVFESRMEDLRA
jgi:Lon protease-like protein